MPGVTARSAAKNMSRGSRAKAAKNARRVEAALTEELESCTYGKITKALGNKMFLVLNTDKAEHLSHIRGKMARVAVDDIVLLNIRDYESRTTKGGEVYDIMAVFASRDVGKLIKSKVIPPWMTGKNAAIMEDELHDLFDYDETSDEEEDVPNKKTKVNHRSSTKVVTEDDSDVDIDDI